MARLHCTCHKLRNTPVPYMLTRSVLSHANVQNWVWLRAWPLQHVQAQPLLPNNAICILLCSLAVLLQRCFSPTTSQLPALFCASRCLGSMH